MSAPFDLSAALVAATIAGRNATSLALTELRDLRLDLAACARDEGYRPPTDDELSALSQMLLDGLDHDLLGELRAIIERAIRAGASEVEVLALHRVFQEAMTAQGEMMVAGGRPQ